MKEILALLVRELGLNIRSSALLVLSLAALVVAQVWDIELAYGAACVLAFAAGTEWSRPTLHCDSCGDTLEEVDLAA